MAAGLTEQLAAPGTHGGPGFADRSGLYVAFVVYEDADTQCSRAAGWSITRDQ